MKKGWGSVALLLSAGLLQHAGWFGVGGITPNFLLASIMAVGFFTSSIVRLGALAVLGTLLFMLGGGLGVEALAFPLLAVAFSVAGRRFPGKPFMNALFFIGIGTVLGYALLDPTFLGRAFPAVLWETVYTMGVGGGLFLFFLRLGYEPAARTRL